MTTEAQRIAIAEACGWINLNWIQGRLCGMPKNYKWDTGVPDYLNDLNAMHEAEKRFNNSKDSDSYIRHLIRVTRNLIIKEDSLIVNTWTMYAMVNATASQRAEAFLRTLGLWKEDEKE